MKNMDQARFYIFIADKEIERADLTTSKILGLSKEEWIDSAIKHLELSIKYLESWRQK